MVPGSRFSGEDVVVGVIILMYCVKVNQAQGDKLYQPIWMRGPC